MAQLAKLTKKINETEKQVDEHENKLDSIENILKKQKDECDEQKNINNNQAIINNEQKHFNSAVLAALNKLEQQAAINQTQNTREDTLRKPTFKLLPYENVLNRISEDGVQTMLNNLPENLTEQINLLRARPDVKENTILLKGPPGTGKSTLAQIIAYTLKRPFVFVVGARLGDEYSHSTQAYIDALFDPFLNAREKRALIIDEINSFTDRFKDQNKNDPGVVEYFWTQLERCSSDTSTLIVATTNRAGEIPEALLSRFGEGYLINKPSFKVRLNLLNETLKMENLDSSLLEIVAKNTNDFTCRELQKLTRLSIAKAITRCEKNKTELQVTESDLQLALQEISKDHKAAIGREKDKAY